MPTPQGTKPAPIGAGLFVMISGVEATQPTPTVPFAHAARWTLASFVATFLVARIVVLLIMTRQIPDLYFYAGQTHVHHLNYGIFLLVFVTVAAILGLLRLMTEVVDVWTRDLQRIESIAPQ